jgi:hypothetical protein
MMQAGMTRADIRRSVRMAQLPKELHETILAEVMRRKRLAENVAINAVWRAFQRLERAAANLNRLGFPNRGCSDSTCWLGGGQQGWLQRIRRICRSRAMRVFF